MSRINQIQIEDGIAKIIVSKKNLQSRIVAIDSKIAEIDEQIVALQALKTELESRKTNISTVIPQLTDDVEAKE